MHREIKAWNRVLGEGREKKKRGLQWRATNHHILAEAHGGRGP